MKETTTAERELKKFNYQQNQQQKIATAATISLSQLKYY
jgi:hypothetical protein